MHFTKSFAGESDSRGGSLTQPLSHLDVALKCISHRNLPRADESGELGEYLLSGTRRDLFALSARARFSFLRFAVINKFA